MTLALVIGVPFVLVVVYGFWLANQLGRGPSWRRAQRRNQRDEPAGHGSR